MQPQEMIQRILSLEHVSNAKRYKAYLERLRPEILQHRLCVLDTEKSRVKEGNYWSRQGRPEPKTKARRL
jgi:hypothetical protein